MSATPDNSATLKNTAEHTSRNEFGDAGIAGWGRADSPCGGHKSELRLTVGGRSHNKTAVGWLNGKARQRLVGGNS